MSISNVVLSITNRWKPILLKIFPYEFLKNIKGKMIKKSFSKILQIEIEPFERSKNLDGINLIGNIKAETGLGQSCRLVADELRACGIPYSIYQYEQLGVMSEGKYKQYDNKICNELPYNINLIHINPHELGLAFQQSHKKIWDGRYNIGFWLWELEDFPDEWVPCFQCMDEIWTPSEFITNSIKKKTDLPVITIPYNISLSIPTREKNYYRKMFGLEEKKFLILMMYDRTSMSERKNPKAVIDAFNIAFSEEQNVGLVIKINNPSVKEIDRIRSMVNNNNDIYFITEVLERQMVNELIYCVDVVVSLHRAEGFGLVLAEAMMLGTPTIATSWSANTEFMTNENACMVDAKLVTLEKDIGSFKKGNRWAEPNVEQAAEYMQRLYKDRDYKETIKVRAKEHISKYLNMEKAVQCIKSRVIECYENN